MAVKATWSDGSSKKILALLDTGAEVNLVNPRVMDPHLFQTASRPVKLGVAKSHLLKGGGRETTMVLTLAGMELDTGREQDISLPVTAYDGEVVSDLILSYGWLAEHQAVVNPMRHGMHFLGEKMPIGYLG